MFRRVVLPLGADRGARDAPGAGARARRAALADAQRCRPGAPASRLAVRARGRGAARSTAPSTSPRRSRCAATASRDAPPRARRAVVAPRPRLRGLGGRRSSRSRVAVDARPGSRRSTPTRASGALGARRRRRRRRAVVLVRAGRRSPTAGGSCDERSRPALEDAHLPLPGRAAPGAARRRRSSVEPRASSSCSPGASGSGKSTLLRAAGGLVPHFHGGRRSPAACVVGGLDTREHGPGAARRASPARCFQDPETQVVMGTVRAELALPAREPRPAGRRRSRAGSRRRRSRSASRALLDRPTQRAVRRRAAARRARPPRSPAARGWCCSTSRPRSSTRSRATSCSGCCGGSTRSGGRRSCSPSTGSSAAWRPPTAWSRCTTARVACDGDPARVPRLGGAAGAGPRRRPARGCSRSPACARRRSGVQGGARHAAPRRAAARGRPPPSLAGAVAAATLRAARRPRPALATASGTSRATGRRPARRRRSRLAPGERVALMGRNGAGKSTLLRMLAGPARADARARRARPGASRCCCRTPATTSSTSASATRPRRRRSRAAGSTASPSATRATSPAASASGSRSRSCSATRASAPAAVVASTSPRAAWTARARPSSPRGCAGWPPAGAAVLVATHDAEFAAACRATRRAARRRPRGRRRPGRRGARAAAGTSRPRPRASSAAPAARCCPRRAPPSLPDADHGGADAVTPPAAGVHVSWQLASFSLLALALAGGAGWYERTRPSAARARAGRRRSPRSPRSAGSRSRRCPNVKPTTDIVLVGGYALGGAPGFASARSRRSRRTCSSGRARGRRGRCRLGPGRPRRRGARAAHAPAPPAASRWPLACAAGRPRLRRDHEPLDVGRLRRAHARRLLALRRHALPFDLAHAVGNVRLRARLRPGAAARARPLPRALRGHLAARRAAAAGSPLALVARGRCSRRAPRRAAPRAGAASPRRATCARPERRRRLRARRPAQRSSAALHGLGGARARRRRAQPARRAPRRARARRLHARGARGDHRHRGDRAHDPRARAAGVSPRDVGGPRPRRDAAARRRGDGSLGGQVNYTVVRACSRCAPPAGETGDRAVARRDGVDRAPAEPRRRLQLRRRGGAERDRRHRRGASRRSSPAGGAGSDAGAARRRASCAAARTPTAASRCSPAAPRTPSRPPGRSRPCVAAGVDPRGSRAQRPPHRRWPTCARSPAPTASVRYSRTSGQTPVWVTAQALLALARRPFPLAARARGDARRRAAAARRDPPARPAAPRPLRGGAAPAPTPTPQSGAGRAGTRCGERAGPPLAARGAHAGPRARGAPRPVSPRRLLALIDG